MNIVWSACGSENGDQCFFQRRGVSFRIVVRATDLITTHQGNMNKGSKPQRPRTRGNGRGGRRNQSHGRQSGNRTNAGSEARIRGNAKQNLDKFLGLAKDAISSGDRVAAENYFQHADHYFRVVQSVDGTRAARMENSRERDDKVESGNLAEDNETLQGLPSGAVESSFMEPSSDDDDDDDDNNQNAEPVKAKPAKVVKPTKPTKQAEVAVASGIPGEIPVVAEDAGKDDSGDQAPAEKSEDPAEKPAPRRRRTVRKKVATA